MPEPGLSVGMALEPCPGKHTGSVNRGWLDTASPQPWLFSVVANIVTEGLLVPWHPMTPGTREQPHLQINSYVLLTFSQIKPWRQGHTYESQSLGCGTYSECA